MSLSTRFPRLAATEPIGSGSEGARVGRSDDESTVMALIQRHVSASKRREPDAPGTHEKTLLFPGPIDQLPKIPPNPIEISI